MFNMNFKTIMKTNRFIALDDHSDNNLYNLKRNSVFEKFCNKFTYNFVKTFVYPVLTLYKS